MMKLVIGLIVMLAGLYALALGIVYSKQGALIYPAPPGVVRAADLGAGFRDIMLRTSDGLALPAIHRLARPGRPTLVFFHGNGDNMRGGTAGTRSLTDAGYGLMLVEYRGYAGNPGSPAETDLYRDGRAALNWLGAQRIGPDRIVLVGNSLGSGIATQLATEYPVAGLAIVSGFTSLPDVAASKLRWIPVRLLMRDRYDNLAKVRRLRMPVLVVHGEADTLIPVSHGVALADAAPRGTLVRVPRVGHELGHLPQVGAAITRWLDEFRAPPPA